MKRLFTLLLTSWVLQSNALAKEKAPIIYPTIQPGFQIIADSAWFTYDNKNFSSQEIRRARIFLKGKFNDDLKYEIEYSLTGGGKWKDLYLSYIGVPDYTFTLGNIKEPIGLEALTSSKYNTFMERALPDTFISDRKLGALATWKYHYKGAYTLRTSLGAFGPSINDLKGKDGKFSLAVRTTYYQNIYTLGKSFFHLGAAASYSKIDDQKFKISTRAESHLRNKLIKAKIHHTDTSSRYGLEAAYQYGPLSLQSEFMINTIKNTLKKSYTFSGWYAQASYFLTDDARKYKIKEGAFGRIKPNNPVTKQGYGAFETTFRISSLDLADEDINGGELRQYTLGLNWYPISHFRGMINYISSDFTGSRKVAVPKIFQLRLQYDY